MTRPVKRVTAIGSTGAISSKSGEVAPFFVARSQGVQEMKNPRGRPKSYAGTQVGVLLPSIIDIRIRSEAQKTGRSISELVRESLIKTWGDGKDANQD